MGGRQHAQELVEQADAARGSLDPELPAKLLQHIDPSPAIGCVDHQLHRTSWCEYAREGLQACSGVRQVMEDPGADDLVEGQVELSYLLDGKLGTSRLVKLYVRLSLRVCFTLVELKSMPTTRADGQRKAYLAA